MSGVASEMGGNMSATNRRNTIMERRLVMTKVILSPESGGTLKAKILRASKETNRKNLYYLLRSKK